MADLLSLLSEIEEIAEQETDGHFTIYRFTTGWKVRLDTPYLDDEDREQLSLRESRQTLEKALADELLGFNRISEEQWKQI